MCRVCPRPKAGMERKRNPEQPARRDAKMLYKEIAVCYNLATREERQHPKLSP